jgi:hypothetical protein
MMQTIQLKISLEEANLILEALGNLPFSRVYGFINKIQEQAREQLATNGADHAVENNQIHVESRE